MSLPGKLCIGILEEDNPLKSYFRFKPLLVEQEGRYVPYAETGAYPEDGSLRIVPDKNESYHFKARMRRIGLFCVVDLRAHPMDNDKIRPNKNYREGTSEQNAFIIYSDVVREPAPDMIFQLVPQSLRHDILSVPATASVLLKGEGPLPEVFAWETLPDADDRAQLLPTDRVCPVERLQSFDLETFRGRRVAFAILPPADLERLSDAPAPRVPRLAAPVVVTPAPRSAAPATAPVATSVATAPVATPPETTAPVTAAPAPATAPEATAPISTPPVSTPPAPPAPAPVETPAPELPAEAPAGEKPWFHHDASMAPRPVDPRLSPQQRSLAAQSGLNPRRGRSLQELIDEKWQRSRLNQLGQPVAPIQTGAPVASPVEGAVRAVREAWQQPGLRQELLEALGGIEEFGASLEERREAARRLDIERHLDGLEARRLALLSELDHLTLKNEETRSALKRQLRQDAAGELAEAVRSADAAKAEQARWEQQAEAARAAAADAERALDQMTGEALERRLADFALNGRMVERLRLLKGEADAAPPAPPTIQSLDLNALAVRVMNRFDASGFAITRLEALNLCACAAVSPVLTLSGPVGSGKTQTARLLAEALGWTNIDRCVPFPPGGRRGPVPGDDPRLSALRRLPRVPAMLLLDDANLYPGPDPLRGLDSALAPQWRLCLTVQDGGQPLPARALDRGFTLRLTPAAAAPWRPHPRAAVPPEAPASLNLAVPEAPLPAACEARMDALRAGLARHGATISRRALDDAWRYCALMLDALGDAADPLAVLDRAVAQRVLPALLAAAPADALAALPGLLDALPLSRALLDQPLPVEIW